MSAPVAIPPAPIVRCELCAFWRSRAGSLADSPCGLGRGLTAWHAGCEDWRSDSAPWIGAAQMRAALGAHEWRPVVSDPRQLVLFGGAQ